jgi:ferredoxin-NADP reductase
VVSLANTTRRLLRSPLIDVFVGPHGIDRYLELIRPDLTVHEARAELVGIRHQTGRAVTLRLRPNGAWQGFRAGQFVRFGIEIDGVRRTRTFSPACSEHATSSRELEFTITVHPRGLVSRYLQSSAAPGTVVHLGAAQGRFTLPEVRPERLFLISGGSGITPVLSMLRTLCDEGHRGQIVFMHYARTAGDWLYQPEVRALADSHENVCARFLATREGDGHVTLDALSATGGNPCGSHVAVCGPPSLIDSVRRIWRTLLGGTGGVLAETFTPPSPGTTGAAAAGELHFVRSGRAARIGPGTLLELAEAAGLRPEFGCRMGICGACRCRKTSGPVRNLLTGDVSNDVDEDIHLCVSAPAGAVALEL